MTALIKLADNFVLPIDVLTMVQAMVANRGRGKTYAASNRPDRGRQRRPARHRPIDGGRTCMSAIDADDFDDEDYHDGGCPYCGGDGWIVACPDDICHGQGWCMHGDGDVPCPECHADGSWPDDWPAKLRRQEYPCDDCGNQLTVA